MSKLLPAAFAIVSVFSIHTANAALINIINDQTSAYAQTTYDSGVVLNPGSTIDAFSGALFPGAVFSGYNLVGDRIAKLPFDAPNSSVRNNAQEYSGEYIFNTNADGISSHYGVTGYTSSATDLNLRFQVTNGGSSMYMHAANEGVSSSSLMLYNETLDILVEDLILLSGSWGQEVAYDVPLYENHIYSLTGSLYAYTSLRGDPQGDFSFKFNDQLAMSRVPEPSTLTILMLALMGLGFKRFRTNL